MGIGRAAALAALLAGACTPARMQGFDTMAGVERLVLTGAGIGRGGTFAVGQVAEGSFRRGAEDRSVTVNDAGWRRWRGRLDATLSGPAIRGAVAVRCGADTLSERLEAPGAVLEATVASHTVRCTILRDGRPAGTIALDTADDAAPGDVVERRRGEVRLDGTVLAIGTEHRDADPRVVAPASERLGYVFLAEDAPVAMVSLAGARPVLALPPDPARREAALVAGAALALMWEPPA